jgi:hypothetical protein
MRFNSREGCRKDRNLYGRSRGREEEKEDNVATRKFTSVEETSTLFQLKQQ